MNRKPFLFSLLFLGFIVHTSISFSQGTLQVSIDPWTTKSGEKSNYYKMLEWDTSPYKEFTFMKRRGPNPWDIEEYINFRMLFPKNYDSTAKDGEHYPLIVFLHGAGESGIKWTGNFDYVNGHGETPPEPEKIDNNDHQLRYGGQEFIAARNRPKNDPRSFSGFVIFPQVAFNGSWSSGYEGKLSKYNRQVIELIEKLTVKYKIDQNRIYIMGLSNGGRGVWDLINRRPDLFAASIIFSAVGDRQLMSERLAHFPLWIFQGGKDDNPTPGATNQMINSLEEEGGTPRFTFYEKLGHNVWDKAFTEPDFFPWLLSKSKLTIHVYFGKTHFDKNENLSIKLGISPGFSSYQWKQNGEIVSNSNTNSFIAKKAGAYQVRFKRGDVWTSWSDPIYITSDKKNETELPVAYRVNVGGPMIKDQPINWFPDNEKQPSPYLLNNSETQIYQHASFSFNNYTNVPDTLFASGRQGNGQEIMYSFPFLGQAKVALLFAEPQISKGEKSTQGILDIIIEGEKVINNFNVWKEAGADGVKKTYEVAVSDGRLDIALTGTEGYPILSGIEVKGTNIITGVNRENKKTSSIAYPNPFKNILNIVLANSNTVQNIIIHDLRGKFIKKEKFDQKGNILYISSDFSGLTPGIYILKINFMNKKSDLLKIVKI